jgi:signal transduction histidine kinase
MKYKIIPKTIKEKIFCALIFLVSLPIFCLTGFLFFTAKEAIRSSVHRERQDIVFRATREAEFYFRNAEDILSLTSEHLKCPDSSWDMETILVGTVIRFKDIFKSISYIDKEGREKVTSFLGEPLKDYKKSFVYITSIKGQRYFSEPYPASTGVWHIEAGIPVYDRNGVIKGVLRAEISLRGIWMIVNNIKIEKGGYAFLVSFKGIILAHKDFKKIYNQEQLAISAVMNDFKIGRNGILEYKERLVAYAPIKRLKCGIVTTQNIKEAYPFISYMRRHAYLILISAELLAVIMSIFLGRLFVKPLDKLIDAAYKIARGNLNERIHESRDDELGHVFNTFNDMMEKLVKMKDMEKFSAIGMATSRIVHEIKNPLVAIEVFVQLLPRKFKHKNFRDKLYEVLPKEMSRLEHLLEEMSDFARGKKIEIKPVNLNNLLKGVVSVFEEEAKSKNISITADYSVRNAIVQGDSKSLEQVFINIVKNAIEAMPLGGSLKILLVKEINRYKVEITDTGIGMSDEVLKKMSDPFFSTKTKGMGLGVSICKNIIELHKAEMTVESRIRSGTKISIKF